MPVLVTCKFEKDLNKNNSEKVETLFSKLCQWVLSVAMETRVLIHTVENLCHIMWFNDRVHVLFLEILCDSGKPLFDISINTGQICMKFEADTPQILLKYVHLNKCPDKKLI